MTDRYRFAVTELGMSAEILPHDITERCDLVFGPPSQRMSEAELIDLASSADALLFSSRDPVTRALMIAAPRLRVLMKFGGKPSNVDFPAAAERGLVVGWTPGANVRSVAEYAVLLILAALRRIDKGLATMGSGGWRSADHIGFELSGRVVGIVGLGAIGHAVASLLRGFGVVILAYDPFQKPQAFADAGARQVGLDELLADADVVTLHCELTPDTRGLIGAAALNRMKRGAVLVNTARGDLIDDGALVAALEDGRLSAAALDVFAMEPLPSDHPLRRAPNLMTTPHISARSLEALQRERFWALRAAIAVLDGREAQNVRLVHPSAKP